MTPGQQKAITLLLTLLRGMAISVILGSSAISCGGKCAQPEASVKSSGGGARDTGASAANGGVGARPIGEHWVQDEHLRGLMRWIASRSTLPGAGGLPEDPEGEVTKDMAKAFAEAAAVAEDLAEAADSIPAVVASRPMSAEDRSGFKAEAAALRERSLELGRAARDHKVERMQRALDAVNGACVSCHSKYRDLSGQLEPTRFGHLPAAHESLLAGGR